MDFLSNLMKHDQEQQPNTNKTDHHSSSDHKPTTTIHSSSDHKPTNSELINSCKIVADAAKSQFGKQDKSETKYDKQKVAAAAANILDAAGDYGKLDHEKGVGKYVEQAEEYLRKYAGGSPAGGESGKHHGGDTVPEKRGHGEGGAGDYMKMAQGFLHKDESGGGGGGSADFMKMAGDFLKK